MKLILLSDLHLTCNTPVARLDNIETTWKRKLGYIFEYASSNNIKILVGGDFFDKPRDWKTLSEYIKLHQQYNPWIGVVFGQHDMYLYSKDRESTSLGILVNSGLVHELTDKPTALGESVYAYGASWGAEIPKPLAFSASALNVLVVHKDISDAPIYPGHEYTILDEFQNKHRAYNLILCGDIHRRFIKTRPPTNALVNPGPLLRMEATSYNMNYVPAFFVFITDVEHMIELFVIPHEHSGAVLTRSHIETKKETETKLDEFIKTLAENNIITFSFKDNLLAYMNANNVSQEIRDKISEAMNEHRTV
jgi:hypothetical protein